MVQRVNQVAAEFRKVSNKQMADTTKRTIRENVAIHVQLAKMSDKTMTLINENDDLVKQLKETRRKITLQEEIEKVPILYFVCLAPSRMCPPLFSETRRKSVFYDDFE